MSSPEDLEDTSDKGLVNNAEMVSVDGDGAEIMDVQMERIFVPEHKNQATSPSHPMAHEGDGEVEEGEVEEYVATAEVADEVIIVNHGKRQLTILHTHNK